MKRTKTKLVSSIVTLLICFAMLVGSTFAWFTDSASTGVNTIQAGNLDVEFYRGSVEDSKKITKSTKLFETDLDGREIIWEPGVVAVEKLIVKNEGNLALKFKMGISNLVGGINYNYVIEAGQSTPTEKNLLDVLYVYTDKDNDINLATARGLSASNGTTLKDFISNKNFLSGELRNGEEKAVSVAIYWPESSLDNEYNINNGRTVTALDGVNQTALQVKFPVTLVATQLASEFDSFDNQYDATATYPFVLPENTNTVVPTPTTPFYGSYVDPSSTSERQIAVNDGYGLTESVTVTPINQNTINLDVNYTYGDGTHDVEVHTFSEPREKVYTLPKNLSTVTVNHSNGNIVLNSVGSKTLYDNEFDKVYYYDQSSGLLYVKSSQYSTFIVTYTYNFVAVVDGEGYSNLGDAINAAKDGDTIVLLDNTSMTYKEGKSCISIDNKNITIDGNGKVITLSANPANANYGIYITGDDNSKTVTIKNATINTTNLERAIRTEGSIGLKIEKSTITTNGVGVHVKGDNKVDICNTTITVSVINNEVYKAHKRAGVVVGGPDANVTVDGCIINAINERKTENTVTWCKGLYVGNSALNGVLTVNNTKVEADFSIGIDGTEEPVKPSTITIHSGEYSGIIGSPSGGSYKSLIINGGTFTGNILDNGGFNGNGARIIISGGTFNFDPNPYCKNGYGAIKEANNYKVIQGKFAKTEADLKSMIESGGTVYLSNDINLTSQLKISNAITLDGGDHKITSTVDGFTVETALSDTQEVIIKNCVFDKPENNWANTVVGGITYRNCIFNDGCVYVTPSENNPTITIEDCTFNNAMLTLDFMNTVKGNPSTPIHGALNAILKNNTFNIRSQFDINNMHTGVGLAMFIREDSGFYNAQDSKVSLTIENNEFVNQTDKDSYCPYQIIQTWNGSLNDGSVIPAVAEINAKNEFQSGAVYSWANYKPWSGWSKAVSGS